MSGLPRGPARAVATRRATGWRCDRSAGAEQDVPLDPLALFGRAGILDAFARTLRGETPPAWVATGTDNLGTLRLMEATIRSAANGGEATPIG